MAIRIVSSNETWILTGEESCALNSLLYEIKFGRPSMAGIIPSNQIEVLEKMWNSIHDRPTIDIANESNS